MPSMTDSDLNKRIAELESAWKTLNDTNTEIIGGMPAEGGNGGGYKIDTKRFSTFQGNLVEMKELQANIDALKAQKSARDWGSAPERGSAALAAFAGSPTGRGMAHAYGKSLGALFTESEEFKSFAASGAGTMVAPWEIEGVDLGMAAGGVKLYPGVEGKDVYTTLPTGDIPQGFAPVQRDPMVMRAFRRTRVRDLFPVAQTSSALIEFFRVTGLVNNASPTPERDGNSFGLKPKSTLSFTSVQMPVRTIAHWTLAHRTVLQDVPQLRSVIDSELLYGLRLVEDAQLLYGTGNGEDLLGFMVTPGIQVYDPATGGATDNKMDALRRAATRIALANLDATGSVIHPNDWEDMELSKDSTGQYVMAVSIAVGNEARLWRLPVVDSPAITEGQFLVGAMGIAAKVYDRMQSSIRIAEQHGDLFVRNAIAVLAEQRITSIVTQPEGLVRGTYRSGA